MSIKDKITKEKWRISADSHFNFTIETENGKPVCKTFAGVPKKTALIIAKAPEMLDILQRLKIVLGRGGFREDEWGGQYGEEIAILLHELNH